MAGVTENLGLPYPEGNDPVRNGDNDIEALARALDSVLGAQVVEGLSDVIQPAPGEAAGGTLVRLADGQYAVLRSNLGFQTAPGEDLPPDHPADQRPAGFAREVYVFEGETIPDGTYGVGVKVFRMAVPA